MKTVGNVGLDIFSLLLTIRSKLADETAMIVTDDLKQYDGVADANTKHETVSDTKKGG
jgi:hypothetical protein